MEAFHNRIEVKEKYLARVAAHQAADEIIKGKYWENGKGCAVGCTVHSDNHKAYEIELGIPEWLARVEDKIFEGLPNAMAMSWPKQFLDAIPLGADLELIKAPFLIFVLESTLDKFNHQKFPKVKIAIDNVINLYRTGETDIKKFKAAYAAATAAAYAAYAAATAAAYAAYAAATAAADDAAATAAAYAAYAAAAAAAYAATAAAAAYAAATAAAAAAAAREKTWEKFADKLLELLKVVK